ncbi:hypothetical protein P9112_012459 [Eukaryota sp. TZLM1-RC]
MSLPWKANPQIEWTDFLAKKAVLWLSKTLQKPITFLEKDDFEAHGLHSLLNYYESFDVLTQNVFTDLLRRAFAYSYLPKRSKVLIFSPHPDDDVICAGATIHKLVENGNDVYVAYQTNGSVAVFNKEVNRYLMFVESLSNVLNTGSDKTKLGEVAAILKGITSECPEINRTELLSSLKANIRAAEAVSAVTCLGVPAENCRFLDLPFYKTGKIQKSPIGEADVSIIYDLLMEIQPRHILIAGDMTDPHGTHELCYRATVQAIGRYEEFMKFDKQTPLELHSLFSSMPQGATEPEEHGFDLEHDLSCPPTPNKREKKKLFAVKPDFIVRNAFEFGTRPLPKLHSKANVQRPLLWLYRGAWEEWNVDVADVFVSLSKGDLDLKIESIFAHQSQKDRAMFPGNDPREFWARARDRNKETAQILVEYGLPKFFACEAFVTTYYDGLAELE